MDIIIHGKPYNGSSQRTPGLDSVLYNRIVDGFFNSMGSINEAAFLVVDATYWNNEWYSIYTFELYKGIRDKDDRQSFFAISIVIPKQYYCLVSEVYKKLTKVYSDYVVGKYISDKGKYIVSDFEDKLLFDGLVKEISRDYTNLLENFDNGFKPLHGSQANIFYNPIDCDAKAFVQSLRLNGRVIVCKNTSTKDSLLGNVDKIKSEFINAQNTIKVRDNEIAGLKKELSDVKATLSARRQQSDKQFREWENGTAALKNENETLKSLNESYVSTINKYRNKFTEIVNIAKVVDKDNKYQSEKQQSSMKSSVIGNRSKLLIVSFTNTILLIFLTIILCAKSCTDNSVCDNSVRDIDDMVSMNKNEIIPDTHKIKNITDAMGTLDMDCGLSVWTSDDKMPLYDNSFISEGTLVNIITKEQNDNYKFHTDNLKDGDKVKINESFRVYPIDSSKPIIISYRSDDINKTNPRNKITLYINE